MQKIAAIVLLITTFFIACKREGGASAGSHSSSDKGTVFTKYTNEGGNKAKMGDFVTLNLQYATEKDSVIFSSYDKPRPLSFKLQKTLFKGLLNDGLLQMAPHDSASFLVPADSLYGQRRPKFMKPGDRIKYTVSIIKVQSQEEYMKEKQKEKAEQGVDTTHLKKLNLGKEARGGNPMSPKINRDKITPQLQQPVAKPKDK